MVLNIEINITIVDDETGKAIEQQAEQGLFMRICHPEMSASHQVCPECAAHWYRVFDIATMQGTDGKGEVPEVGWHTYCVCEDVPFESAKSMGYSEKKWLETLIDKRKDGSGDVRGFGANIESMIANDVIDVKDVFKKNLTTNRQEQKKQKEIELNLYSYNKPELLKMAKDMKLDTEKFKDLKKADMVSLLMRAKPKDIKPKFDKPLISIGVDKQTTPPVIHIDKTAETIKAEIEKPVRDEVAEQIEAGRAKTLKEAITNYGDMILKITENKYERTVVVDKKGAVLLAKKGEYNFVAFTKDDCNKIKGAEVLLHNHPRSNTFSVEDISLAIGNKIKEIRAIAPDSSVGKDGHFVFKNINIKPTQIEQVIRIYQDIKIDIDLDIKQKIQNKELTPEKLESHRFQQETGHTHFQLLYERCKEKGLNFEYYWESKDGKTRK